MYFCANTENLCVAKSVVTLHYKAALSAQNTPSTPSPIAHMYMYKVFSYTASALFVSALRTSLMCAVVLLLGSGGESDVHMLASRDYSVCQRGDVTVFLLRCAYDVGDVKSVRLWHDSSGDRPSW